MSGKLIKRAIATITLAALPVVGMAGSASATTQAGSNAVWSIEHHYMGWGYDSPYDCSALMQKAFKNAGRYLPRTTDEQWNYLRSKHQVSWSHQTAAHHQIQYGDILFFWNGGRVQHVGIYIGHNEMIDSNSSAGYIKVDNAFYNWGFDYITYGWVK